MQCPDQVIHRPRPVRRRSRRWRRLELAALDWQARGLCRGTDQSVFFGPDDPRESRAARLRRLMAAKRLCAQCPVLKVCRDYALANEEEYGVWGGLSEAERKRLIRGPLAISNAPDGGAGRLRHDASGRSGRTEDNG